MKGIQLDGDPTWGAESPITHREYGGRMGRLAISYPCGDVLDVRDRRRDHHESRSCPCFHARDADFQRSTSRFMQDMNLYRQYGQGLGGPAAVITHASSTMKSSMRDRKSISCLVNVSSDTRNGYETLTNFELSCPISRAVNPQYQIQRKSRWRFPNRGDTSEFQETL